MLFTCLLLLNMVCTGDFLIDSKRNTADLTDNHFIAVVNMFTEERRARKELQEIVLTLKQTVENLTQEVDTGNAVNQTCIDLSNKYDILKNRCESDITALDDRLHILEGSFTMIQNENKNLKAEVELLKKTQNPINNEPGLNTRFQTMNSTLQQLVTSANTMEQEFLVLSNKTHNNKNKIDSMENVISQRMLNVVQNMTQNNEAKLQTVQNEIMQNVRSIEQNLTQTTEERIQALGQKMMNSQHNTAGESGEDLTQKIMAVVQNLTNDSGPDTQSLQLQFDKKLTSLEHNLKQASESMVRSLESDLTKKISSVKQNLTKENEAKINSVESELTKKIDSVHHNLTQHTENSIQSLKTGLTQEMHSVERNLTYVDAYVVMTAKSGRQMDYHVGQAIKFPTMVTSYGINNVRSFQTSGVFKTETPGLYLLSVRVQAFISLFYYYQDIHMFEVDIQKNAQTFSRLHIEYSNVTVAEDTTVVVTHLNIDDEIAVVNSKKQMTVDADSTMTIVKIK